MKSFKERCKKIASGKWFFPVVMNVIVMFLLMLLFYARYQCEMDVFMQTLLYGTSGTGTPMSHLVFINVIAGGVLDLLIKIAPGVAWYTVMHYAGTLAALISISYVFVNRYGKTRVCKILATVISIFVGYECYITPMYMKTTILLAAVSVLWMLHAMTESKRGIGSSIWAVIFGAFSALLSFKICVVGYALSLVGAIIYLIMTRFQRKHLVAPLISLVAVIIIGLGSHMVDLRAYASGGQWEAMGQQRDMLEQIYVMGYPSYEEMEDVLVENGYADVTEEEYNQLMQGFFYNGIDCNGILQVVAGQRVAVTPWKILLFFHTIPIKAFKTGMFYLWLVLAIAMSAFRPNRKTAGVLAISVVMFWIPYFAQYFSYGCDGQWMGMIAYLPAILFLLWNMPKVELPQGENRYVAVYLCLMGLVLYYIFSGTFVGSIQETEDIGDIVTKRQEESEYAHLVDLTGYFQKFSIYMPYVEKMDSENGYVLNGYYLWVPGYRNYREMYLNGYVGYNLYVRNDVARRCVVNSIKLDIALSGYEREYTTDFNGMRQYSIVQKTYAEAEDDSL